MSTIARFLPATLALILVATGCKQGDRAVKAPPTRAELPVLDESEPRLPASVGVEGAAEEPRAIFVPKFEEIELTPEEREALGEKEEPPLPDALAFYEPPRGPQHGVYTEVTTGRIDAGLPGGAEIGHILVHDRVGVYGYAGRYSFSHSIARSTAGVGLARPPGGVSGRPWLMNVGEGLAREGARAEHRAGQ